MINQIFTMEKWLFDQILQKLNGTLSQRTPFRVSCDRVIRYPGFFFGVRETWVLLEIAWNMVEFDHVDHISHTWMCDFPKLLQLLGCFVTQKNSPSMEIVSKTFGLCNPACQRNYRVAFPTWTRRSASRYFHSNHSPESISIENCLSVLGTVGMTVGG